jgi:hypothetical protein
MRLSAVLLAVWLILFGGNLAWAWGLTAGFLGVAGVVVGIVILVELFIGAWPTIGTRRAAPPQ